MVTTPAYFRGYRYIVEKIFSPHNIGPNSPDFDNVLIFSEEPHFETEELALEAGHAKAKEMTEKVFRWSFCGQPTRVSTEKVYTIGIEKPKPEMQQYVSDFHTTRGTHQNYQNG